MRSDASRRLLGHAAGETEMDQLMRTIPLMDITMVAALLREAKEVFDELGVVFLS